MDGSTPADQPNAGDVTDLQAAQRRIAQLGPAVEQHSELTYFADGEFTIFLDDEHANMVLTLFEHQSLVAGQDPACELHDALSEFVSHWLDIQWHMLEHGQETSRA
jgi:hypothetical protein